jgi:hypothetical protein
MKRHAAPLTYGWGNATNRMWSWDVARDSRSLRSSCRLCCCCLLLHLPMTLPKIKYLKAGIHSNTLAVK